MYSRIINLSILTLLLTAHYSFSQCSELSNLTSGIPNVEYGRAVDVDGNRAVIGSKDYTYGVNSGAVYVYDWNGSSWVQTKLTASDASSEADFGASVSISGNRILVGAPGDGPSGVGSGSAYVFDWNGSTWVETKLTASDGTGLDKFGSSVSISGDRLVVSAIGDDDYGSSSGSIYTFVWDGATWIETKLTPSDGGAFDGFGISVGISGDRIVVGSYYDDDNGTNSGSIYIYDWVVNTWVETKITASEGTGADYYGTSVDISGDIIGVGAVGDDDNGNGSGSLYIYQWNGANWNETKVITSDGASGDNFGTSISCYGNRILVDAHRDDDNGLDSGSAYIYELIGNNWNETKLTASDGQAEDNYGISVGISNNMIIIGAYHDDDNGLDTGSAYIYELNANNWAETKITAIDGNSFDRFGTSVSIFDDRIVVGAVDDETNGANSGAVFIHDWNGSSWATTKLVASDGFVNDRFGTSVDVNADRVIVGSPGDDDNGTSSGSIYIYDWNGASWQETKITSSDGSAYDNFGESISIDGDRMAIGAFGEGANGSYSGSVYVYDWNGSNWQETKLIAADGVVYDFMGRSVSISGNTVVAGAYSNDDNGLDSGSIYVFTYNGSSWSQTLILPSDGANGDNFGKGVSVHGSRIVAGADKDDDNGTEAGSIYVYDWDGSNWIETKLLASNGASFDNFGASVSNSGNRIAVGAANDDNNGSNSGSVYLFEWDGSMWVETNYLSTYSQLGSASGSAVAVSDDYLVMGIPNVNVATVFTCSGCVSPPVAICKDITINLNSSGTETIADNALDNGSTDDCSTPTFTVSKSTFNCTDLGINVVTLTVSDDDGNSSTCNANVTVVDNTPPIAQCQNYTATLDVNGNAIVSTADINNGSSDECGIASMTLSQTLFNCSHTGDNTITLTVIDNGGNQSTCNAIVTIINNALPMAQCQDYTVYLNSNGNASINATDINNGSSSTCGIASMTLSQSYFTCSNLGNNTVILTVTDNGGAQSTCSATVTVLNSEQAIICQNHTAFLDASGIATITTADINNGSYNQCGIASMSLSQTTFDCDDIGNNNVVLTVTDTAGNQTTCSAIVSVLANTAPIAQCQNHTAYLSSTGSAYVSTADIDNGSSSQCGTVSLSLSQTYFNCSHLGDNTVTLTVTDNVGNQSTCNSVVTVINTQQLVQCQDHTAYIDGNGNASIAVADINNGSYNTCGISSLSLSQTSFNCNDIGDNTVILTVTDTAGNQNTCSSVVTVVDNIGACCPINLTESSNPITNDYYQAEQTLNSAGIVPSNGNVSFGASTICLDSGFEVQVGATFEAVIDPCGN